MPLYEVSSLVVIATETASDSTTDTAEEQEDDHFVEPVEPIDEGPPSPYNFPVLSEDDVETESTSTDFFVVEDTDEFVVQMKLKSRTPSTSHLGKTSKAVQVDVGQTRSYLGLTGRPVMMLHRKWRESKQQPSRARSGHQISCCLVSLHFLCDTDILSGCPVQSCVESFLLSCENFCRNHFPVILSHPRAETRLQGDLVGCRTGSEEN